MRARTAARLALSTGLILVTAACGNVFGGRSASQTVVVSPDGSVIAPAGGATAPRRQGQTDTGTVFEESRNQQRASAVGLEQATGQGGDTFLGLFGNNDDPNVTLEVNKYIWAASLDILDFMPIQAADPFSGIIVYGYGTPPGSGRSYRATVYVQDPALDARSLRVALATRSGPASSESVRAVEDAILTRARQLRIAEGNL